MPSNVLLSIALISICELVGAYLIFPKIGFSSSCFFKSSNGQVRDSVFDDYYKRWEKILAGDIEDWSTFPMIYKMDDVEEVTNPDLYEKAMPFVRNISDPQIIKDMLAKTQYSTVII